MFSTLRAALLAPLTVGLFGVALLVTPDCGCAPAGKAPTPLAPGAAPLPGGFDLSAPWETGTRHRIIRAYHTLSHRGVNRSARSNDAYALDFDLASGEPVLSVAGGMVLYAGPAGGGWATYGNIVLLRHVDGISSLYAHLESINVRAGRKVTRGARLGAAGNSGGGRVHLHLALYRDARLANGARGAGLYGGALVLPEPFGAEGRMGLAAGQCITAG